jgi:GT2 family glycosyltransferase
VTADHGDMTVPSAPLCVIPSFLRTPADLDLLVRCLVSLWTTAPGAEVLVVDDGSPERSLLEPLAAAIDELGYELIAKEENEGFSRTVNVGLRRALETGRDAVLVNADIEFHEAGWLDRMVARTDTKGRPAAVVGARLLYPNGCIQHAGVFFAPRSRAFWHRCQYAPANLPEALLPMLCPVTGALQLIRHETLTAIGVYDDGFRMGYEDVDYCLRVFDAGLECIYEPTACAIHHESVFRGRKSSKLEKWHEESLTRLKTKWVGRDLSLFIPAIL